MDLSSSGPNNPININHVAISVPNLEQAIKWYQNVFGFKLIGGPVDFITDDSLAGMALKDIHGETLRKMRMAWLVSENHVGFEIIEYVEPEAQRRQDNFEYWKSGITHFCITDPNIEELCHKITEQGGKQRSNIWEIIPNKGYKISFCEDPFGNIIEIYSNAFEDLVTEITKGSSDNSI
jgi:catechol 2,3-dioxygenase-like lactoylglutathione lyase family enzyme